MYLCCVLFLIICAYVVFLKYFKKIGKREKWELIGTIEGIYVYPLDGGPAKRLKRALCTKSGLRNDKLVDRTIIAYSAKDGSAIFNVEGFDNIDNRIKFFYGMEQAAVIFNRQLESSIEPRRININYLGDPIEVIPFPTTVALANLLGPLTNEVKLCYFAARKRRQFMKVIKGVLKTIQDITVNGFSSHYSTFTIIDAESFLEFRREISQNPLAPISFNPQLIVNGKIPHNATVLRIGGETSKIKFGNITPCNIVLPLLQNLYSLFGFNMQLKNQTLNSREIGRKCGGMIKLGDEVYIARL